MSYAIRNDGQGSRSVSGPEDVGAAEYFSDTPSFQSAEQVMFGIFRVAIQEHLDNAAKALGYDDIKAAVTYAEEPSVPKFQAEGQALRAWRSLVWAYGYDLLAQFQAGIVELPTQDELIAGLPKLDMPS
ncbi:hypothetical protein [Pseudomonas marginalis]|uniref:hypothetical protein n=1 Tax=Pseudomonas marginalis TaxID=298 RepID=UPI0011B57297|nr:hypothetical protein [Pseudomonas marginalis]KAA8555061.1 hypothetical protein FX984_01679 [Pseudomonas marginalis]TWR71817.1 hypothetical protein FIV40_08910 [Pseudomonas marginalis]